jgi:PKD repeat protein
VDQPVPSPKGLVSANNAGLTSLSWQAVNDPAVVSYRVYAKRSDLPSFGLIAAITPPVVTYNTTHTWGSTPEWTYLVIARTATGTESFFDSMVDNYIHLVAGLSADVTTGTAPLTVAFTDKSTGTVTDRKWDFNGDGLTDSTQINPTYIYTTPGTYAVTQSVTGPDGTDQQTRTGYIVVNSSAVNGVCGSSNGSTFASVPKTSFCSSGTASPVTGTGPWNWLCSGSGGGASPTCSAMIIKPGDCDNSGTVTIAEVQSAINMFLGLKAVAGCVDMSGDSSVSIAEVQKVINSFLGL